MSTEKRDFFTASHSTVSRQPSHMTVLVGLSDESLSARTVASLRNLAGFSVRVLRGSGDGEIRSLAEEFRPDVLILSEDIPPEICADFKNLCEEESDREGCCKKICFIPVIRDESAALWETWRRCGAEDFIPGSSDWNAYERHLHARVLAVRGRLEREDRDRQTIRAMSQQSRTDVLTELPNRRALSERLVEEVSRAIRGKRWLTLFLIDIDNFKRINDTYGHPIGDEALKTVGNLLRRSLRMCDCVGRYGGDEFLAILPETQLCHGVIVAERIRQLMADAGLRVCETHLSGGAVLRGTASPDCPRNLKNPEGAGSKGKGAASGSRTVSSDGIEAKELLPTGSDRVPVLRPILTIPLSLSIGVASIVPRCKSDAERLLQSADKQLYQAKSAGKGRILGGFLESSSPEAQEPCFEEERMG